MKCSGRSVAEARRVIEIDVAQVGEILGRLDAGEGLALVQLSDDPAGDLPGHVAVDGPQALVKPLARQVIDQHFVARQRTYMCDACAHLARADDADPLYCRHSHCLWRHSSAAPSAPLLMTSF